jgi:hypothetical protein
MVREDATLGFELAVLTIWNLAGGVPRIRHGDEEFSTVKRSSSKPVVPEDAAQGFELAVLAVWNLIAAWVCQAPGRRSSRVCCRRSHCVRDASGSQMHHRRERDVGRAARQRGDLGGQDGGDGDGR